MNHCKIRYETDADMAEYSDFYDFSSSYAQYQDRLKLVDQDEEDDDEEMKDGKKEGEEKGDEKAVLLLEDSHRGFVVYLVFSFFFVRHLLVCGFICLFFDLTPPPLETLPLPTLDTSLFSRMERLLVTETSKPTTNKSLAPWTLASLFALPR